MFCSKCGTGFDDDTKFCPNCGTPTSNVEAEETNKEVAAAPKVNFRVVALILAVIVLAVGCVVFLKNQKEKKEAIEEYYSSTPGDMNNDIGEGKSIGGFIWDSLASEEVFNAFVDYGYDKQFLSINELMSSTDDDAFVNKIKSADISDVTYSGIFDNGIEIDKDAGYFFYVDSENGVAVYIKDKKGKNIGEYFAGEDVTFDGYYSIYPYVDDNLKNIIE